MELATPFFEKSKIKGKYSYEKFGKLIQTRIEILSEIPEKVDFLAEFTPAEGEMYFNKKFKIDSEVAKKVLEKSITVLENVSDWNEENLHAAIVKTAEEMELKSGVVYTVLRIGLTGVMVTPGGSPEMADILGKEESLNRLKLSLEKLK